MTSVPLMVALALVVGCGAPSSEPDAGSLSEASMNFDLGDVAPFLARLPRLVEGLGADRLRQLSLDVAAIPVGSERSWEFQVRYQGEQVPLRVQAVMDDVDAADLYFYTTPELAHAIQLELATYAESSGI